MRTIVIDGGRPLFGRVAVSGSKNAALPIIFSTVITRGVSLLHNVPDIGDVRTALDIIQGHAPPCLFHAKRICGGKNTRIHLSPRRNSFTLRYRADTALRRL